MQEKRGNFFQICGFSIRKGRFPCSFLLKEKNQKFPTFWLDPESSKEVKAAPASLHSPFIPLFALQTRFAQTGNAHGRSIPVVRLTLTSRGQSFLPSSFSLSLASLFSPSASGSLLSFYLKSSTVLGEQARVARLRGYIYHIYNRERIGLTQEA